jgi:hypothetical protein
VLESLACCSDSPMTPIPKATSRPSVLISYVDLLLFAGPCCGNLGLLMLTDGQKIRTIELDGKTVKLQIVRFPLSKLLNVWRLHEL